MLTPETFELPGPDEEESAGAVGGAAVFRVPVAMMRQVIDHLASALPSEGCGLLAVLDGGNCAGEAVKFYPGTNADRSSIRYTMDPAEVLAAFKEMRANGQSLGAIVHSHPVSDAIPSPTDLREAFYPHALMLIVSFAGTSPAVRAWRVSGEEGDQQVIECLLVID